MKLLLVAPTLDATDVGESRSTFEWVSRLAARHEVTVVTYFKRGRPRPSSQVSCRVLEWEDLPVVGRFERLNSLAKPGYVAFAARARGAIARLLAAGERFDIAHQLAPLALRYASPLRHFGIPYVIGPLGGSLPTPAAFRDEFGAEPWYVRLRGLDRGRLRWDRGLRASYSRAAMVLGVAPYVQDLLEVVGVRRFAVMSETGVASVADATESVRPRERGRLRLLFVGRLVRSKGAVDVVRAMRRLGAVEGLSLDIVGDGPERAACEREIRDGGLQGRVSLHGRQPRSAVEQLYRRSDVFVFPSFREPSGNVVVEAMSHGLAMIVADRGGPAEAVDEHAGFKIAVGSPDQFAGDIANAVDQYWKDPGLVTVHGEAALARARECFLWERKIERLDAVYARVVAESRSDARAAAIRRSGGAGRSRSGKVGSAADPIGNPSSGSSERLVR